MKEPLVKLWTVLLIAMVASAAYGQTDQGLIGGKVKDSSGAIIPGATVTTKNERTGEERTTLTNDAGDYVFPALRPSEYKIKATLPGFAPAESKPMQVVVGQKLSVDFTLQPAAVSTTVNVEAAVETSCRHQFGENGCQRGSSGSSGTTCQWTAAFPALPPGPGCTEHRSRHLWRYSLQRARGRAECHPF